MTDWLYWYCTDFIINLANITGSDYFSVNSFFFFVLFPAVTLLLFFIAVYQWARMAYLFFRIRQK